jgi:hypothetical protein
MDPLQQKKRGEKLSLDGLNLGKLLDDYWAMPISPEEARARQKSFSTEIEAESRDLEKRNRKA